MCSNYHGSICFATGLVSSSSSSSPSGAPFWKAITALRRGPGHCHAACLRRIVMCNSLTPSNQLDSFRSLEERLLGFHLPESVTQTVYFGPFSTASSSFSWRSVFQSLSWFQFAVWKWGLLAGQQNKHISLGTWYQK